MRRTLKIKTRLLLTVGFVTAMLAASSGVALWRLGAVEASVEEVVRGDARLAGVTAQLVLHVGDLAQHERAYLSVSQIHGFKASLVTARRDAE